MNSCGGGIGGGIGDGIAKNQAWFSGGQTEPVQLTASSLVISKTLEYG